MNPENNLGGDSPQMEEEKKIWVGDHSERRDDEVFMGNVRQEDFEESDHQTKRMGNVAIGRDGKEVVGMRPWFVKKSEMESKGYTVQE